MKSGQIKKERRMWPRKTLTTPETAILYPLHKKRESTSDTFLAYVINISEGGVLIESPVRFKDGSLLDMWIRLSDEGGWTAFEGKVIWLHQNFTKPNYYLLGVQFQRLKLHEEVTGSKRMLPSDVEFLMHTQLFNIIPQEAKCPLLNCIKPRYLRSGERLISQGEIGDTFYLIQHGSCLVSVEKDKKLHAIARVKPGDIVGEIATLTGEPRSAHVDAETDMKVWCITRKQFDSLCREYPDLLNFLTEIVTNRFYSSRVIADRTIGKYVVNEVIGRGGYSIVYKGIHSALNMPVAIKMLKHDLALRSDFSEQFINEAKVIARLNHDNIVKVFDIEELYRTFFIIMEHLEGVPLKFILEKMPKLPLNRGLDILLQVCHGLAYAHGHGIIHRDINPNNIFILPDGRVKIVDFGLACSSGSEGNLFEGTIFYISPEQIRAERLDERTDIYSLGIMAYEMVTGKKPFPYNDIPKIIDFHLQQDIPDPRESVPDLPDELINVILRCTKKEPSKRYQRIQDIIDELKPLAEKMGLETQLREKRKMLSLFVFYQDEQQLVLKRLVEEFSNELKKMGVILRAADFKDVQ
jgi:Tfp pilus assembly protein PilZ